MKPEQEEAGAGCCWGPLWVCVYKAGFVSFPSVFVSDSEMRALSAEQRALKAEEALQSALVKIQDLERNLQARSSLSAEGTAIQTWN